MKTSTLVKNVSVAVVGAAWIALGVGQSAHAASIVSSADSALSGASVIDFETAPGSNSLPGTSFNNLTMGNVTFSAPNSTSGYINSVFGGEYSTQGKSLQNTYTSDAFGVLNISFTNRVSAFGFNWGASNTTWTLKAFDAANNLIDSLDLAITEGSNAGEFFGIKTGGSTIKYATLQSSSQDWVLIDNFKDAGATQAVPTPALLPGLIGLGLNVLRKRKAAAAKQTSDA